MIYNPFKAKKPKPGEGKPFWWQAAMERWKKDGKGTIDVNDPEFDAQKIYRHWLDSFR
jgi:hypothetical protein